MTDPQTDAMKGMLKTVWSTGDYDLISRSMRDWSEAFAKRIGPRPGDAVLDIACGSGQITLPFARMGAQVTGLDLSEPWLEAARARAAAEGLEIRFEQGDAEALPYPDASFDLVTSLIGAQFAPNHQAVADEALRVTKPGGRIVLANWAAEGFAPEFFGTVGRHAPPPPEMPSPLAWGDVAYVRGLFGPGAGEIAFRREALRFRYEGGPAEVTAKYRAHFGPVRLAFEMLDAEAQAALEADLIAMFERWMQPTEGGITPLDGGLLVTEIRRA